MMGVVEVVKPPLAASSASISISTPPTTTTTTTSPRATVPPHTAPAVGAGTPNKKTKTKTKNKKKQTSPVTNKGSVLLLRSSPPPSPRGEQIAVAGDLVNVQANAAVARFFDRDLGNVLGRKYVLFSFFFSSRFFLHFSRNVCGVA
jgi:hypothetical protein